MLKISLIGLSATYALGTFIFGAIYLAGGHGLVNSMAVGARWPSYIHLMI